MENKQPKTDFTDYLTAKFPFLEPDFYFNNDLSELDEKLYLMLARLSEDGHHCLRVDDIAELLKVKPKKAAYLLQRLNHTTLNGTWKNGLEEVTEMPLVNMFFLRDKNSRHIDKVHFSV